jgi:hypothetical protein
MSRPSASPLFRLSLFENLDRETRTRYAPIANIAVSLAWRSHLQEPMRSNERPPDLKMTRLQLMLVGGTYPCWTRVLRAMSLLDWTVSLMEWDGQFPELVFHCWSPRPNPYKDVPINAESRMWRKGCATAEECFNVDLLVELEAQIRMLIERAA